MKKVISISSIIILMLSFNACSNGVLPPEIETDKPEYKYLSPVAIEESLFKKAVAPVIDDDNDKDGVINSVDRCPNTPPKSKVNLIGCTILADDDKDGVANKDDKCPDTKMGIRVDYKGCELDSDDDGVVDSQDRCPNTSKDFVVDGYGCPQTATLKVNFAFGKSDINQNLIDDLQTFALFLKQNRGYNLIIYGYTDDIGQEGSNQKLSLDRANAVKEVLTRYGISAKKMTTIGKGETGAIGNNKTKDGRAQNRRIKVELIQSYQNIK